MKALYWLAATLFAVGAHAQAPMSSMNDNNDDGVYSSSQDDEYYQDLYDQEYSNDLYGEDMTPDARGGGGGGGHGGGGRGGGGGFHPPGGRGPGGHIGGANPRRGWHNGYQWDHGNRRPNWWQRGHRFPIFVWIPGITAGYWQCTAFNSSNYPYSALGLSIDQAAYNALYDCGGSRGQDLCYIPAGYCNYYYP